MTDVDSVPPSPSSAVCHGGHPATSPLSPITNICDHQYFISRWEGEGAWPTSPAIPPTCDVWHLVSKCLTLLKGRRKVFFTIFSSLIWSWTGKSHHSDDDVVESSSGELHPINIKKSWMRLFPWLLELTFLYRKHCKVRHFYPSGNMFSSCWCTYLHSVYIIHVLPTRL